MPASSSAAGGTERQEEDRQLFELDKQRSQCRQQLLQCRAGLQMRQKEKRRAELCLQELSGMPSTLNAYKLVGEQQQHSSAAARLPLALLSPAACLRCL